MWLGYELWPQGVHPYRDIAEYLLKWIDPASMMCLRVACGQVACDAQTHEPAVGLCACGCNILIKHGSTSQLDWFERVVGVNALCGPAYAQMDKIKWLYQRGYLVHHVQTSNSDLREWASAQGMCYDEPHGEAVLTREEMEAHVHWSYASGAPPEHNFANGNAPSWLFETALDMGMLSRVAFLKPETITYRVADALLGTGQVKTIGWWLKRLTCDLYEDYSNIMDRVRAGAKAYVNDYSLAHKAHGIRWCVENETPVLITTGNNLPVEYIVANIEYLYCNIETEKMCTFANVPILHAMLAYGFVAKPRHITKMIQNNVPARMIQNFGSTRSKHYIKFALAYGNISVLEWLHSNYTRKRTLHPRWYMRFANAHAYEWVRRYFQKQSIAIVGPIYIKRIDLELIYKLHRDKIEYKIWHVLRLIESEFIFIDKLTSRNDQGLQNHDANQQSRAQV